MAGWRGQDQHCTGAPCAKRDAVKKQTQKAASLSKTWVRHVWKKSRSEKTLLKIPETFITLQYRNVADTGLTQA